MANAPAAGASVAVSPAQGRWVLAAAILGSSMAFVDGTVVNVALPAIQRELRATASNAQWVVEAYALFLAALLLVGGALGDHFGRRRVFGVGVALFALASVGCALSGSVQWLIAARAVQGVGGALLVPGSLALISASFGEHERGKAIGTWSGFSGITAAFGPVLGGFLVDRYSWAWAFLVNVPIAAAVLLIVWAKVPESHGASEKAPLDIRGALLATVALGGVVFAFIEAPALGWGSARVLGAMAIGLVATAAFIALERHVAEPMMPLHLFGNRNFAGANLLTLLLYAALGGGLFFVPLNLIQVQGYGATAAGAALLPFVVVMFALSRWAGKLVDRVGSRLPLVVGPSIAAAGFALFAVPAIASSYWTGYLPAVLVMALGMSITVAPLTTTVMNSVGEGQAGIASGVNNAVSRTAGLLAIAVFGMVMAWVFDASLDARLHALNASPQVVSFYATHRASLAAAGVPTGLDETTASALHQAVRLSFVAGFRWIMLISAALAIVSALAAWLMIDGKVAKSRRK